MFFHLPTGQPKNVGFGPCFHLPDPPIVDFPGFFEFATAVGPSGSLRRRCSPDPSSRPPGERTARRGRPSREGWGTGGCGGFRLGGPKKPSFSNGGPPQKDEKPTWSQDICPPKKEETPMWGNLGFCWVFVETRETHSIHVVFGFGLYLFLLNRTRVSGLLRASLDRTKPQGQTNGKQRDRLVALFCDPHGCVFFGGYPFSFEGKPKGDQSWGPPPPF